MYEAPVFYELDSMRKYLKGCLDETIISNNKTKNYIYGNDCDLLTDEILLEVCYATLFTLHVHVNSNTFMKNNYLKEDIITYFGEVCKEIDLDERIHDSFVDKYSKFEHRSFKKLEQAFVFLKNCGLITVAPIVTDLEEVPDIGEDLRLIAHGREPITNFKEGLFRKFNMCIKYPAFYVAILKDILKEQMPDHLPKEILRSIVECHVRGLLPEDFAAEYHDTKEREIDYVNVAVKTAVEITVSNKPMSKTHFDLLDKDYRKILLTKDRDDVLQGVRRIPYYEFLANGADFNAYTKESTIVRASERSEEESEVHTESS